MIARIACAFFVLTACAAEPGAPGVVDRNGLNSDDLDSSVEDSESGDGDGNAECEEDDVRDCKCKSGKTGKQACVLGEYTSCNGCFEDDGSSSKCVPGLYSGRYAMEYTPGPAGFCGLATLFGGSGGGNWSFSIEKSAGEEFYTVGDGCLIGKTDSVDAGVVQAGAEAFANGVVMRAQITGVVDCATGELKGELRGYYNSTSFCGLGLVKDNFFFKGPVSGVFDPKTKSFVDGVIVMREPEVLIPLAGQPGGRGTWTAQLGGEDADAGVTLDANASTAGGCLNGVTFKDFPLPDAGP
jgi:hypothetical protein